MKYPINKNYSEDMEKLVTTDPGHADTFNPKFEQLLNNDAALNEQLAENEKEFRKDIKSISIPENYDGAIAVFVDDDAHPEVYTKWKPIADTKGINITIGVKTGLVGQSGIATLDQLKELQNDGHEIVSHTKTHPKLQDLTDSDLESELKDSHDWLVANGFNKGSNILVYPYGITSTDTRIKNAARKYYDYGIDNKLSYNFMPVDNFFIGRKDSDNNDLANLKAEVDTVLSNKGLLVFMSHSARTDFDSDKISQLIDYIKSKNVPIMTFAEAVKYKGNALALGEYTEESSVYISKKGDMKATGFKNVNFMTGTSETMDNPITDYKADSITYKPITTSNDTFLGIGGSLITYRSSQRNFSYQTFTPYNKTDLYMRKWDEIVDPDTWGAWTHVAKGTNNLNVWTTNTNPMDADITAYELNKETIVPVNNTNDTLTGYGGVMRVFRSSLTHFSYATFIPYNSNTLYMRKWKQTVDPNVWGTWEKIAQPIV